MKTGLNLQKPDYFHRFRQWKWCSIREN